MNETHSSGLHAPSRFLHFCVRAGALGGRDPKNLAVATGPGREIVLFADTFNRYFERENIDAALAVLGAAGYRVEIAKPKANGNARPLCCGRTFLAVGKVGEARHEAERAVDALTPFVKRGLPIVGLEPSCIFGFRDEIPKMLKSDIAQQKNFWRPKRKQAGFRCRLVPRPAPFSCTAIATRNPSEPSSRSSNCCG